MTLSCNCDMPLDIYCDWCQDQGWDCDELRVNDEAVAYYSNYEYGDGGYYGYGRGSGDGRGYWGLTYGSHSPTGGGGFTSRGDAS